MVWVPGHSKGLASTIVKNKDSDNFLLLVSDVGYASKSWKENVTPSVLVNKADAQNSLNWVSDKVKDEHCVEAVANHDPDIQPHTVTL